MTRDPDPSQPLPRPPRAVVFDFDGVIVESTRVKTEAFRELFSDYPQHLEAIVRHHQEHLGHSRFEKFEWIYRELLRRPLPAAESAALGRRFAALVVERVVACPLVDGARATLERLRGRCPAFLISGTPQEELLEIVRRRGLASFFVELHGAPASKPEILRGILQRHAYSPADVLMVGDGISDFRAASAAGVDFLLRATPEQREYFAALEVASVPDLVDLPRRLNLEPGGRTAGGPGTTDGS